MREFIEAKNTTARLKGIYIGVPEARAYQELAVWVPGVAAKDFFSGQTSGIGEARWQATDQSKQFRGV